MYTFIFQAIIYNNLLGLQPLNLTNYIEISTAFKLTASLLTYTQGLASEGIQGEETLLTSTLVSFKA